MKRFVTSAVLMGVMFVAAMSLTANSASAAPYVYAGGYTTPYVSTYYPGYYVPRAAIRRGAYVPAYNYYTPGYVTTPTYYTPYPTTTYYTPYTYGYRAPVVYGRYSYGY